jgi:rubredoxin
MARPEDMWQCQTVNCGYIYNPDKGDRKGKIPKGVLFEDLPEEWRCPICGATKKCFKPLAGAGSVAQCETETMKEKGDSTMARYVCTVCGYVYDPKAGDPDNDIPEGTSFEDLPEDWTCPVCGAGKSEFEKEG